MSLGAPRAAGGAATFAGGSHFFLRKELGFPPALAGKFTWPLKGPLPKMRPHSARGTWRLPGLRPERGRRLFPTPRLTLAEGVQPRSRGAALSGSAPWLGVSGDSMKSTQSPRRGGPTSLSSEVDRGQGAAQGTPGDSSCLARVGWVFVSAEGSRRRFWKAYKISAISTVGAAVTCRPLLGGGELGGPGSGARDKARLPPARRPLTWGPSLDKPTSPTSAEPVNSGATHWSSLHILNQVNATNFTQQQCLPH